MTIETTGIPSPALAEYAAVPIAFEVRSVLSAESGPSGAFVLVEHAVARPYVKDYDAVGDSPLDWQTRFDASKWGLFLCRIGTACVGGATVALATPGLDLLEDRHDLALLWDIRVEPAFRGRGIGRALFEAAEAWALARGCRELKIETQNINVPACRFYAALGCQLRVVRDGAYPEHPEEIQFLWSRELSQRGRAACWANEPARAAAPGD